MAKARSVIRRGMMQRGGGALDTSVVSDTMPLVCDDDGVLRVGGTRVPIDAVVAAFHSGATPEEILQQYPSLDLADIYAVLGYYLRHQTDSVVPP